MKFQVVLEIIVEVDNPLDAVKRALEQRKSARIVSVKQLLEPPSRVGLPRVVAAND